MIAEAIPKGMPNATAKRTDKVVTSSVYGSLRANSGSISYPLVQEVPKSRVQASAIYFTYLTSKGRSRYISCLNSAICSGVASSPRMDLTTSPGANESITNKTKVTPIITGISSTSLLSAYFNQSNLNLLSQENHLQMAGRPAIWNDKVTQPNASI